MILDESAFSDIDDAAVEAEMLDVIYKGSDNRPAWIGGCVPRTSVEGLRSHAKWAINHRTLYLNFVSEYVERLGNVLDIGCGAGQNTAMLSRYANGVTGIDSDEKAITFARKYNESPGVKFVHGKFPACAVWGDSFDYIFCVETMEHVAYDEQEEFIDKAVLMLRDGGYLFITTPREDSASAPHIGVWSPFWTEKMKKRFAANVVAHWYVDNTQGKTTVDAEIRHHALVMQR